MLTLSILSCKDSVGKPKTKKEIPEFIHTEVGFSLPSSIGIINDFGQVFTEPQRTELKKLISDYIVNSTKEIVIVTIDSINPYDDIKKYAIDLGNDWGVGALKWNNGLTIVLCKPCRKIGIATGTGTEQILTNKICKDVIENKIIPELRKGDFFNGIKSGLIELINSWK